MSQPRQYVPEAIVRSLVDDFLASRKGRERAYCSAFRPDDMRTCLCCIPVGAFWDGRESGYWIAYHEAVQVVLWFQCHKLTAHCDAWTPWMLDALRKAKVSIAKEFLP